MIRTSSLPNGLLVLTESMSQVRSATVGVWCDVGSSFEPAERRGISHLLEHMVFKGTQRRTARQIAEEMDAVGGELNAMTDKESTCFYANLGDPTIGFAGTVAAIGREDLLAWRASRYAPSTTIVTAAGNVDHDEVVRIVGEAFAAFAGSAPSPVPERPRFTPALDVTIDETEQAYVLLGAPGLGLRGERRYALSV